MALTRELQLRSPMLEETRPQIKPFLKWLGGKSQLLKIIENHLPSVDDYENYYEPFLGGGAVFFGLIPTNKKSYLGDVNENLIGAYLDIRDNLKEVLKNLRKISNEFLAISEYDDKRAYFNLKREKYNSLRTEGNSPLRTAHLIFLNKTCFNGVYRENRSGEFNVPFGDPRPKKLMDMENIRHVSDKLQKQKITTGSFEKILKTAKKGDLVYLDPPYVPVTSTANFTSYHALGFGDDMHSKVAEVYKELHNRGCFVLLSNSAAPEVVGLYEGFTRIEIKAKRAINCKKELRGDVTEVLIKNY